MNTTPTVEVSSATDAAPLVDPLFGSKLQLVHNTNWKTVEVNGEDVDIPQEWNVRKIGECASLVNGYAFKSSSYKKGEKFKVLTIRNVQQGYLNDEYYETIKEQPKDIRKNQILNIEDIVLSMTGNVGRVCMINNSNWLLNQRVLKIIPLEPITKKFLFCTLKRNIFCESMQDLANGGAQKNISSENVRSYMFFLPPKTEQTLIAQTLTTQEDHIASLKQQSSLQRKRLDWLTEELLSGRIRVEEDVNSQPTVLKRDEHGETIDSLPAVKLVANTDWKTVEVNGEEVEIPEGWDMSSPSLEKFKIQTGRKNANDNSLDGIYPFFTCSVENVLKISSYSFDTEALLINGNGDVGHVKYYKGKFDAYQRVYVVDNIEMDIHYVRLIFEKYFKASLSVQGGAMPYIKVDAILTFGFRKPSLDEQTLIAQTLMAQEEYIASLDQMIAIEEKRLAWLTDELLSGRILIQEVK